MNQTKSWQSLYHPQNFSPTFSHRKAFFFLSIYLSIMGNRSSHNLWYKRIYMNRGLCVMDIKLILPPSVDEQEHLVFGSSERPVLFEVLTRSIAEASGVIFLQKELHQKGRFCNRRVKKFCHYIEVDRIDSYIIIPINLFYPWTLPIRMLFTVSYNSHSCLYCPQKAITVIACKLK